MVAKELEVSPVTWSLVIFIYNNSPPWPIGADAQTFQGQNRASAS